MSALRERARKAAASLCAEWETDEIEAVEEAFIVGYRAALEDAAKLVCGRCANRGGVFSPAYDSHGLWYHDLNHKREIEKGFECYAGKILAALAEIKEAWKP